MDASRFTAAPLGSAVLQCQTENPGASAAEDLGGQGQIWLAEERARADQTASDAGAGEMDHRM